MASRAKRQRIRKHEDPAVRLARSILPEAQVKPGLFVVRDVVNHTDADQRRSERSGEKRTIERKGHIQTLASRGVIEQADVPVLRWYADQHELGFATVGCTANYCGAGGGGFGPSDLLARYKAQSEARANYRMAWLAIPPVHRQLLDRVVLGQVPLTRAATAIGGGRSARYSRIHHAFRQAVRHLTDAIGHLVERA